MEPTQITYDICRCYLQDRRDVLPVSLYNYLHGLVRARDYRRLASCCDFSAHDVTCAEVARTLLQVEAFFKKNVSFTAPLEARLSALLSFEDGERRCAATNDRLDTFCFQRGENPDLELKVEKMQYWISNVLGDFNDFLELIPKLVRVTPGATASRSRRNALPFLKITKKMVCTPGAFPYLNALSKFFGYGDLGGRFVSRNRVAFVPKSWKTERTIACEPDGNLPLQLSFDSYAKRSLIRKGINLYDQTKNQEQARIGSISGNVATIDLSMASDTLSYNTTVLLLPEGWRQFLCAIRSQYYEMYPSHREAYHKFSSMGNGATFTLETLVFSAACYAVGSRAFSCYGDDITIERELALPLIALLDFLGFMPNQDKTFIDGPFRESCGKFWWEGIDITPRYIRELDSRKAVYCHLVNSMMSISKPYGELQDYLVRLVRELRLPVVPYNEDTMSGVWVDAHTAYERKLIRTSTRGRKAWRVEFRAYQLQNSSRCANDLRTYFLWHLGAWRDELWYKPDRKIMLHTFARYLRISAFLSSRYTISSHKYVRKWVHWSPVVGAPDQLNSFSDLLFPEENTPR